MANEVNPLASNPFGVMTLDALAASRLLQDRADMKDRQSLKGASYAAATFGNALGNILRDHLVQSGSMVDPEQQKAERITQAVKRAKDLAIQRDANGNEVKFSDPFDQRMAEGDALVSQLDLMGYSDEADKVRDRLLSLQDAALTRAQKNATLQGTYAETDAKRQTSLFNALGDAVTVTVNDGSVEDPITVQQSPTGYISYTDPKTGALEVRAPGQYTKVTVQGNRGEVGKDKITIRDFNNQLNGANSSIRILKTIRDALVADPQTATFGQTTLSYIANIGTQARSYLVGKYGPQLMDENAAVIDRVLKEANIKDKVMQARVSNVSYAIASSREGGKLTDQDVKLAGTTVGAFENMSPEARIATMDDFVLNVMDNIDFKAQTAEQTDNFAYRNGYQATLADYKKSMNAYNVPIPGRDPTSLKRYGVTPGANWNTAAPPKATGTSTGDAAADAVREGAKGAIDYFENIGNQ